MCPSRQPWPPSPTDHITPTCSVSKVSDPNTLLSNHKPLPSNTAFSTLGPNSAISNPVVPRSHVLSNKTQCSHLVEDCDHSVVQFSTKWTVPIVPNDTSIFGMFANFILCGPDDQLRSCSVPFPSHSCQKTGSQRTSDTCSCLPSTIPALNENIYLFSVNWDLLNIWLKWPNGVPSCSWNPGFPTCSWHVNPPPEYYLSPPCPALLRLQ